MTTATAQERPVSRAELERLEAQVIALKALLIAHLPSIDIPGPYDIPIKLAARESKYSEAALRRRSHLPQNHPDHVGIKHFGGRALVDSRTLPKPRPPGVHRVRREV